MDWYPWGDEAFSKAREADKPIFLSIGYSACHWCHVMERESFENETIADYLNRNFVCIKVDREERPDVDDIYMNAVQMMTGSGGWPLSVFLTPELKPFYGGTYFPPEDRFGRIGFLHLLQQIVTVYMQKRKHVYESADKLTNELKHFGAIDSTQPDLDPGVLFEVTKEIASRFDPMYGGFGAAPKFPPTGQIDLLLRVYHHTGYEEYLDMVVKTLTRMGQGGIFDQLAGGFARYSTDETWLVPHFEKMLYDNALLVMSYLECYQVTKVEFFADIARRTLDWVLTEMTDTQGGFYSSFDADSEGEEGKFYVWKHDEIKNMLGEDAKIFISAYGITDSGNFEHNTNILSVNVLPTQLAEDFGKNEVEITDLLKKYCNKLLDYRNRRIKPGCDDKILTDWNGLMIAAFARAYRVLDDKRYLDAAHKAARFISEAMLQGNTLHHSYRAGNAGIEGTLDDYAFMTYALVELYQTDFNSGVIDQAIEIVDMMIDRFLDRENGGFFMVAEGRTDLIDRPRNAHDSSIPSGNALAAKALLALYQLTGKNKYLDTAEGVVKAFSGGINRYPTSFLRLVSTIDDLNNMTQVVIAAKDNSEAKELLDIVNSTYIPGAIVAANYSDVSDHPHFAENKTVIGSKPTAYLCKNFVCDQPVNSAVALQKLLVNNKF